LLENAFRRRYGFFPVEDSFGFWKPHGDCAHPGAYWVLPHQAGVINDSILAKVSEIARSRPRALLIVGYSERDAGIVQRLIEPMSKQWRVYRISPTAAGDGAIPMDAGHALESLANALTSLPAMPGWVSVSFENQRGVEAAVSGERLGPGDVVTCARLPHFTSALRDLDTLHAVTISGSSGSGKSITVWQLAHHYNQRGWHVIRPGSNTVTTDLDKIGAVASKRWPTVVVVDDIQFHSGDFLDSLRQLADVRTKLILGATDANWEQYNTIRVSASAAVRALVDAFKARRNEILPIVKRFDSQVGDEFLSIRIEDRIDSAAASETPWLFAYALRGGWRQTQQLLSVARDFDNNDLLLTALAIRQVASLDAGATIGQLVSDAQTLGYDALWVHAAVKRLEAQRAILVGDTIRCLHLQSASAIVSRLFESRTPAESPEIIQVVRNVVSAADTPVRGISWLLHEITDFRRQILAPDLRTTLLTRCLNAHTHTERRDASFVLSNLLGWRDITAVELLTAASAAIREWVAHVDREDAYSLGCLINNLYNDDNELCRRFLRDLQPNLMAGKLLGLDCDDGYAWGYFLDRLRCACPQEWADQFSVCIPRSAVLEFARKFDASGLGKLSQFIEGVAGFDLEFALDCLDISLPVYVAEFARDSLTAYRKTGHLEQYALGNPFFRRASPTPRQRSVAKAMLDGIDPRTIVAQILTCPFGDWENYARLLGWAKKVHGRKVRQVADAMDWARFDAVIGDSAGRPAATNTARKSNELVTPPSVEVANRPANHLFSAVIFILLPQRDQESNRYVGQHPLNRLLGVHFGVGLGAFFWHAADLRPNQPPSTGCQPGDGLLQNAF
jgi:hypothetical protein